MVAHNLNPSTWKAEAGWSLSSKQFGLLSEFQDSQSYTEKLGLEKRKSSSNNFKKQARRAGEMAQRLRALTALLKVLSSNPNNHLVAHNHP